MTREKTAYELRLDRFSREEYEVIMGAEAKAAAGRFTRGNIAIQLGRLLTEDELELERATRRQRLV